MTKSRETDGSEKQSDDHEKTYKMTKKRRTNDYRKTDR